MVDNEHYKINKSTRDTLQCCPREGMTSGCSIYISVPGLTASICRCSVDRAYLEGMASSPARAEKGPRKPGWQPQVG